MTESMTENDLNNERRKKLQEKQRVRRQVEDEITELTSELFSKKVCSVGYEGAQFLARQFNPLVGVGNMYVRLNSNKAFDTERAQKRKSRRPPNKHQPPCPTHPD